MGKTAIHDEEKWKAVQEKRRREEAIANTTKLRILAAVSVAVPVRLMQCDLLLKKIAVFVGELRLEAIDKQHGIRRSKDTETSANSPPPTFSHANEGTLRHYGRADYFSI